MTPVAITRVAIRSALGNTLEETVAALRRSEVGVRTPSDLEQTPKVDAGAGEVPLSGSDRGAWRAEILLRRTIADLLSASDRASIDAGPERWGIVLGTTLAGMRHCGVGMRADEASSLDEADDAYARTCASSVLSHALRDCCISGPTLTVSCACASALSAVNHACSLLESGAVDFVIAGGYDPLSEFVYGGFAALQLVATGPLSPFAPDREGMKLGEGAALFLLRRARDIVSNETDSVRGFIVGTGESSDAHHLTQPHPEGSGAARALLAAIAGAEGEQRIPDLLVAHATGTPGNDGSEYQAYRAVFGDDLRKVPIVGLKSRFGHPLGAAGVLEVASALGCADAGFVPTTAGRGRDREAFPDLDLIEGNARVGAPRDIVVLSAGFGGANAATRVVRDPSLNCPSAPPASRSMPLAVTAVGAVTPAGRGAAALVARMQDPSWWPAFSEETLAPLLDRSRTRRLALLPRLMIAAVRDLAESSGLTADELSRTPLLAANWCGAADFTERYYRDLVRSGLDLANPMLFAESVPNIGSAQCSLAFGITAPSLSVIGRRTAGLEAMLLAHARLTSGEWSRAIIVAAEEEHPIVARTLSRCAPRPVPLRSGAIAFLVEPGCDSRREGRRPIFTVDRIHGRTAPFAPEQAARELFQRAAEATGGLLATTSNAPFDDPAAGPTRNCRRLSVAEIGAATPFAVMLADAGGDRKLSAFTDPHGACWAATLR
jgi:3-oxoacyl-[acyl-carrier-protein] synthase II